MTHLSIDRRRLIGAAALGMPAVLASRARTKTAQPVCCASRCSPTSRTTTRISSRSSTRPDQEPLRQPHRVHARGQGHSLSRRGLDDRPGQPLGNAQAAQRREVPQRQPAECRGGRRQSPQGGRPAARQERLPDHGDRRGLDGGRSSDHPPELQEAGARPASDRPPAVHLDHRPRGHRQRRADPGRQRRLLPRRASRRPANPDPRRPGLLAARRAGDTRGGVHHLLEGCRSHGSARIRRHRRELRRLVALRDQAEASGLPRGRRPRAGPRRRSASTPRAVRSATKASGRRSTT